MTTFTTNLDIRNYVNSKLENYDAQQYGCSHDELIEKVVQNILNHDDFEYNADMTDILIELYNNDWNL